jgi:ABC-type sugar transport system ATPase subunit
MEYRGRLNIATPDVDRPVGQLSGGNQQKVVLARWLLQRPRILIVDEPTRGIDVAAKAEVHSLLARLAESGTAILMISSDLPEVLAVSDRILVMREGRLAGELAGDNATEENVMRYASVATEAVR